MTTLYFQHYRSVYHSRKDKDSKNLQKICNNRSCLQWESFERLRECEGDWLRIRQSWKTYSIRVATWIKRPTTYIEMRGGANWTMYWTIFYILTTDAKNQIKRRPQIWSQYIYNMHAHTRTYKHQPFNGSLNFVRHNPGKPIPEETFNHWHLSWSSVIPYLLHPSITIHGILPVPFTYLTVFFHNLSPSFL